MQLDALLKSLVRYWEQPDIDVHILYRASRDTFINGYERLKGLFPTMYFHQEKAISGGFYSLTEPKGTDCKSAAICFGGSNPPPPISRKAFFI